MNPFTFQFSALYRNRWNLPTVNWTSLPTANCQLPTGSGAAAGTTQTVALVQGTITNQVGKKVVSATDRLLVVTNAPWLFQGDGVRITTSAGIAFSVVGTGVTRE